MEGVRYMLMALSRARSRRFRGGTRCLHSEESSLEGLPDDILDEIELWVVHGSIGLERCAELGLARVVRAFAERARQPERDEALCRACAAGHLTVAQALVRAGAGPHVHNDNPVRSACEYGHLDVVKFLRCAGADVHALTECGLKLAAMNGHTKVVDYLVESCNADVHVSDDHALVWATARGHLDVVKSLVGHGANVRVGSDSLVCLASSRGHLAVLKYLIERGGDPRARHDDPVLWAIKGGNLDIVHYLADVHNAELTARNHSGAYLACKRGALDVLKFLVSRGVSTLNNYADSLACSCKRGDVAMVKFLVEDSDRPGELDDDDDCPLCAAREEGRAGVVEYLLRQGGELVCLSCRSDVNGSEDAGGNDPQISQGIAIGA